MLHFFSIYGMVHFGNGEQGESLNEFFVKIKAKQSQTTLLQGESH